MNDLDLIRDLGESLEPRNPAPPTHLRARVLAGLTAERPVDTSPARTRLLPPRGPARRPLLWGVPLAAAATVAALLAGGILPIGGAQSPGPIVSALDGRSILLAAADQAADQPWTAPAADQFVYRRWTGDFRVAGGESGNMPDDNGWTLGEGVLTQMTNETWLSVDGTHLGRAFLTQDGAFSGQDSELRGICPGPPVANAEKGLPGPGVICDSGPGVVTDIPTDAAGALTYLRTPRAWASWTPFLDQQPGSVDRRGTDTDVVANAWLLLTEHLVPPQSRAAIFEALATVPGVKALPDVTTSTGRKATAVVFPFPDARSDRIELLFDPTNHEVIGYRVIVNDPAHGIRDRVDMAMTAVDDAVVPVAGTRPDGSKAPAPPL